LAAQRRHIGPRLVAKQNAPVGRGAESDKLFGSTVRAGDAIAIRQSAASVQAFRNENPDHRAKRTLVSYGAAINGMFDIGWQAGPGDFHLHFLQRKKPPIGGRRFSGCDSLGNKKPACDGRVGGGHSYVSL
jgi:hypothetical protein